MHEADFQALGYDIELCGPAVMGWLKVISPGLGDLAPNILVNGVGSHECLLPPPEGPFAVGIYHHNEGDDPEAVIVISGREAVQTLKNVLSAVEGQLIQLADERSRQNA